MGALAFGPRKLATQAARSEPKASEVQKEGRDPSPRRRDSSPRTGRRGRNRDARGARTRSPIGPGSVRLAFRIADGLTGSQDAGMTFAFHAGVREGPS